MRISIVDPAVRFVVGRVLGLAVLVLVAAHSARADVSLAGPFTDNCVLQRDMPLPIFGFADPQESVTVELNGQKETTQAGADGRWQVNFKPQSAGGPYTLKVTGKNSLEVKNVLIGEVWIGVGQSNMMMQVAAATGGAAAVADLSKYPNLRMAYEVAQRSPKPQEKIGPVHWGPPNAGSSAAAFFFALQLYDYFQGKVPVGVATFTEVDPAQSWADPEYMKTDPKLPGESGGPFAGLHFNTVIKPIAPMALRGGLYYQGEMNAGWAPSSYFCAVMTAVIESWRKAFGNESLPFLFVQLPGYQDNKAAPSPMDMPAAALAQIQRQGPVNGFCEIREAQLMTLRSVPHTGMAVTIDVGEQWNIHPHNKKAVGDRLFLQARHVAYHDDSVIYSGPLIDKVEFEGPEVVATFDQIGSKLVSHGDRLAGFELAGSDQVTHPAEARIEGNKVIISSEAVKNPVGVYYAWAGFPIATLFNAEGLPASPFRAYDYSKMQVLTDTADFPVKGFDTKDSWYIKGAATFQNAAGGNVYSLAKADDQILQGVTGPTGYNFNANVAASSGCLRPGDLLGYSVEMAAGPGTGDAVGYFRLNQGSSYWDRNNVKTSSEKFAPRSVAIIIPPETEPGTGGTLMFANLKSADHPVPRPFLLRNVRGVKSFRATLGLSSSDPIDLGQVAAGATAESKPIVVTNTQKGTLPEEGNDAGKSDFPTVIYGLADVKRDETAETQVLKTMGNDVGAILIGPDAADFEFNGPNATADKRGVRFVGADKSPGLAGGPNPESESFTVRFHGEQKPGTYQATVRIVTQASNLGMLSQGKPDQPPANLYYVDLPVKLTVP